MRLHRDFDVLQVPEKAEEILYENCVKDELSCETCDNLEDCIGLLEDHYNYLCPEDIADFIVELELSSRPRGSRYSFERRIPVGPPDERIVVISYGWIPEDKSSSFPGIVAFRATGDHTGEDSMSYHFPPIEEDEEAEV